MAEKPRHASGKIVGYNFLVMLVMVVVSGINKDYWLFGLALTLQAMVNGLIALRRMDTGTAAPYALAALLLLIIGFGFCSGPF